MSMSSRAVDTLDLHTEVRAEIDAIMAKLPPMPTFGPVTSGLCGYQWHGQGRWKLPWPESDGLGYRCTLNAGHAGDCKNQAADGTTLAFLRVKDRIIRTQVPDPVVAS